MPVLSVKPHNGAPTLFVDGAPAFAGIYLTVRNFRRRADRSATAEQSASRDAPRAVPRRGFTVLGPCPVSFDDAYDAERDDFPAERFAP